MTHSANRSTALLNGNSSTRIFARVVLLTLLAAALAASASAQTIVSFSPTSAAPGTILLIQGNGFTGATGVTVNGVTATNFLLDSDTKIRATVPAGAGTGPLCVTYPSPTPAYCSGTSFFLLANNPAPSITTIFPTSGWMDMNVTISGSYFSGATAVNFGATPASMFTVNHDGEITASVPSTATTGPITVQTPRGTSPNGPTFTKTATPTVTAFEPVSGAFGAKIMITGSGFSNSSTVSFGGVTAAELGASDTTITSLVPAGAVSGPICVNFDGGPFCAPGTFTVTGPMTAPAISMITPSSAGFGSPITINGSGFTGTTYVKFNGLDAPMWNEIHDGKLTLNVPPAATSGPVTVSTGVGTSPGFAFTVIQPPTLNSFSPASGAPGTLVTINGTGFSTATGVSFFAALPAAFTIVSDTQITATVPAGATTSGPITVTTAGGSITSATNFTVTAGPPPTIASFSPVSGPPGTSVVITGTGFTGATSVQFMPAMIATYTVNSDSQITATVPAGAGTGSISVVTPNGSATSTSTFTVTAAAGAPTVTFFSPVSGSPGTIVTINGTGFSTATSVTFMPAMTAAFTIVSDTQLTATVPTGATTGSISVTNANGTGTSASVFTIGGPPPTIASFSPISGPPGTSVVITGTGFTGATSVQFVPAMIATFTVNSDSQITATVPATAGTGPITVNAPGGNVSSATNFTVTAAPGAPVISSFTPLSGCIGSRVFIVGSGFMGATAVRFNSVNSTSFTVVDDNNMNASVPNGSASGPISVQTPLGQATTGATSFFLNSPWVNTCTPPAAAVGSDININGSCFTGATGVSFNGVAATFVFVSDSVITATVPPGATSGPVTVTSAGGSGSTTFSVSLPPTIASFSPGSGPVGTEVTITGTGFDIASIVQFNGVTTTGFIFDSSTQVRATVPPGATTGPISVSSSLGTAQSPTNFTVVTCPPPTAPVISAPDSVCPGATATASIANPVAGTTYTWSIASGTITSATTGTSITFAAPAYAVFYSISVSAVDSCGAPSYSSKNIAVGPAPFVTLAAPVCPGSTGNQASVPDQPGSTYNWSITGGTITSNGTRTVTFDAGAGPNFTLTATVSNSNCPTIPSNTLNANFQTTPSAEISAPPVICGATVYTANSIDPIGEPAATYAWSATNASITTGTNGPSLGFYPMGGGPVQLTLTKTISGCGTSTVTRTIPIGLAISGPPQICPVPPGGPLPNLSASVSSGDGMPFTPTWSIQNGTITSTSGNSVYFTPNMAGDVVLSVSGTGCGTAASASLTIPLVPQPVITAPVSACPNQTLVTASVTSYPGATYHWEINGTDTIVTGGQGTPSITFTAPGAAGNAGGAQIHVSIQTPTYCYMSADTMIGIGANATITAPDVACAGATGLSASVPPQANTTFSWSISGGTFTSGTTSNAVTFDLLPGVSGVNLMLTATGACGPAVNSSRWITIGPQAQISAPSSVCAGSVNNYASSNYLYPETATYSWSILHGSISGSTTSSSISFSSDGTGDVQLTLTKTGACGTATATRVISLGTYINAPATLCVSGTVPQTFYANGPGDLGATFTWTAQHATPTTGTGNSFAFTPDLTGSVVLTLTETNGPCAPTATVSKTIPVVTPPAITAPAVVCQNQGGYTASVPAGAPGTVYNWTINGGAPATITAGQNTNSITFSVGAGSGLLTINVNVSDPNTCGMWTSKSIPINADATVTAPPNVCINSTGNPASVPLQSGATYTWSISGGTITAGQGTRSITFSAGTASFVELYPTVTTSCGSNYGHLSVPTSPSIATYGPSLVCANSSGNIASVALQSGTSYLWTITNGTITSGATSNQMTYSVGATGPAQVTITATNTCGSNTLTKQVSVGTADITAPPRVCANRTNIQAFAPWVSGGVYSWTISGGTITSTTTGTGVTFTAGASGNVVLGVTINGTACGTMSGSLTIPIDPPVPPISINAPLAVCPGVSMTLSATPVSGATYNWSVGNGTITSGQGSDTITVTPGLSGSVSAYLTASNACNGSGTSTNVPIGANATITAPPSVCINSTGNTASLTPQSGATYSWSISGGTITAGQGSPQVTFSAGASPSVWLYSTVSTSCGANASSKYVATSPQVGRGETFACANSTGNIASIPLEPNTSYSWTITNGTITSGVNSNQITFDVGTLPVSLTLTGTNACGTASNTSTVDVGTPSISGPASVCANSTIWVNTAWIPGATYTWNITGGTFTSPQSGTTITGTGMMSAAFMAGASGSANITVTIAGTACGTVTGSRSIPISDPFPSLLTLTTPAAVCPNSTGNAATVNTLAGATYNWSISGGTITAGQGTPSITFNSAAVGFVNLTANVSSACGSRARSTSVLIGPNTGITAPSTVCLNQTGNLASVPLETGATYSWTITNGTITAGQSTNRITFDAGSASSVQLSATVTDSCGSATGYRTINTSPSSTITGPGVVCSNSTGNTATLPLQTGATYTWTITNGTITAGQGTNVVTFSAGASGNVDLGATVSTACGTSTSSVSLPLDAPPYVVLSSPGTMCAGATATAFMTNVTGVTYSWTISNGTITAGQGTRNISFIAGSSGDVMLTGSAASCTSVVTLSRVIGLNTPIVPAIKFDAGTACAGSLNNFANAANYPAGATFSWTITNGTITAGATSSTVTFTAGTSGPVTLGLTVSACGGSGSASLPIPLAAPPDLHMGMDLVLCPNSANKTAQVYGTFAPTSTFAWSMTNGTITSGQGTEWITFTAGASGSITATVTVTSCGVSVTKSLSGLIGGTLPLGMSIPATVCPASTNNIASTSGYPGATYSWSIVNGTITSSPNFYRIAYTAGTTGTVDLTLTVTTCLGSQTVTRSIPVASTSNLYIGANDGLCANATNVTAGVSNIPGATYSWSITNGTITSATTGSGITYAGGASGVVTLAATVTSCAGTVTLTRDVPINATPTSTIYVTPEGARLSPAVTSAAPGGLYVAGTGSYAYLGIPGTYQWSITNGTILDDPGDPLILFQAGTSGTTVLTCTVTTCGGTSTSSYSLPVTTANAAITAPTFVCGGSASNAASVATQSGASYNWTITNGTIVSGQGTNVIAFTAGASGSVTLGVSVTAPAAAPASSSLTIPITTVTATITASGPTTFCQGGSVTLTATGGTSYQWFTDIGGSYVPINGATSAAFVATTAGSFTVQATSGGCTATSAPTVITVNPLPTAIVTASGPLTFCSGGSVTLTASTGAGFQWLSSGTPISGATAASYVATTAGSYSVVVTGANGCATTSAPTVVSTTPAPTVTIIGPTSVCPGTQVTLDAGAGFSSYLWSTGATTQTISITPTAATTVNVTVSDANGCAATASTTIAVTTAPTATITAGGPTTFCDGGSVLLTASSGNSYQWYKDGVPVTGGTTQAITVVLAGNYTVEVTLGGCKATSAPATITIGAPAPPVITSSGPTTFCSGGSIVLSVATGSASYQWLDNFQPIAGANSASYTVTATGNYSVQVTDVSGCSSNSVVLAVSVNPAPTVAISGPTSVCAGGTATLDAGAGYSSYLWSTGATTQTITVSPTVPTSYSVTVTNSSGCSATGSTFVAPAAVPAATVSAPANLCSGSTGNIAAVSSVTGATYTWTITGGTITAGAGTNSITFTAGTSGFVFISVTVASGTCTSTGSANIPISDPIVAAITGPTSICPGASTTLDAGAGFASYTWSNGATTQTITVSPTVTTQYLVTVANAAGCTATANTTVAITQAATPAITAPTSVCASSTANVASVASVTGATYTWTITGGTITAGAGTASITFTAGASGSITLGVTVANGGCSGSATLAVPIAPAITAKITGPTTSCPGSSVTLDAGAGYTSYSWSTGASTQTITVAPTATTTYSVTVQSGSCSGSASQTVIVTTGTAPAISVATSVCADSTSNTASVPSTTGATYTWTLTGGTITAGQGSSSITFTAGASGSVTVGVTVTSTSCGGSASQTVPIVAPPSVTITGPSSTCAGSSITLDAGSGFASYSWSNGANTQTITVSPAAETTYNVTVTTSAGCSASASQTVAVSPAPSASITLTPTTLLAGSTTNTASVPAGPAGTTYQWSLTGGTITAGSGTSSVTFTTAQSGAVSLSVTVTGPSGCKATAATNAVIQASADLSLAMTGSANAINAGGTLTYTIAVANSGPSPATNVSVAISTRGGASIASAAGSGWTCIVGGTTATCTVPSAPVGTLPTLTIKVTAPSSVGSISTSATVSSASTDANPANNVASLTASVTGALCSTTPPQLTAPAEGATNLTSPIIFSWTAVPNAAAYELWLGSDTTAPTIVATVTTTSATANVSGKSGTWYVAAQLGADCPTLYSAKRTFTIFQPPVCDHQIPVGTAPADKTTVTSPVTFSWTLVPEAIGYRVWISVDGGAQQDVASADPSKTSASATVTPGAITWQVEAQFSGCPSTRSTALSFTVPKPDPCAGHAAPLLTSPSNGTTATSSVEFRWSAATDASGYRVWGKIDDAAAAVLGTASAADTSLKATISSGHVEWWVESLYDGCPSLESEHRTLDIPKAVVCGTDVATLVAPAEGATVNQPSVMFSWNAPAQATGYELWLSLAGGTPSLVGKTTSTTLTVDVPSGSIEWFVRASFDGCPTRDSAKGHLTYTPPPACSEGRPLLNAPADNSTGLYSPVDFTWRDVPGATAYRVWATRGNAVSIIATTTIPSLSAVPIPPGRIEWYVEALFGGNCPTTSSSPNHFTVVPAPPPCSTPEQPVILAESTASSGSQYLIRWNGVAPGSSAMLQESLTGNFDDAGVVNTTDSTYLFLHINKSNNPITYYYRVRAIGHCNNELQLGPYSNVSAIVILPDKPQAGQQLQGSTAADSAQSITYTIPIGPEFAGLAFTATPNETWLTVTPITGVVPVGGTTLTVVAKTTGLPVGTTLGGVTITMRAAAGSNRSDSQATTTINTTVSVNLVQPILPTPKNTPPPDALIIPAVSHADGINSKFQSDVRLTNTSAQVMKYQVTFTPSGEEGIKSGKQTSIDVAAGQTLALDDVLGTWFNSGAFKNLIGTLEIRPVTQVASSTSSVSAAGLQTMVSFASSRTFAATANGSYGQYVPAIPFANFIGKGASTLSLQQIAQSAAYRTNLGLVEGSGQPATVNVAVFGASGSKVTDFNVGLTGGQHVQLNGFLQEKGIQLSDGRVEVKVTSPNGKVTAYASVLDNATNDPLLVTPVALNQNGGAKYVLPGVADLTSGFAKWRTDMRIFNASSSAVDATLTFYSQNKDEAPRTAQISLAANEVKQFDGVVSSLFGANNNGGALHITTAASSNLVATGRTYNQTTAGTYGQFVGAVTPADAIALGSRPLQILQVEESSRFRSNIGLAEVSGKPVKVQMSVIPPDGRTTAVIEVNLQANEFRQMTSLLKEIGLTNTYNARVSVKVLSGDGRVTAYASVIDAQTQDPTYIPAQ